MDFIIWYVLEFAKFVWNIFYKEFLKKKNKMDK